jgi:hypothetical protein
MISRFRERRKQLAVRLVEQGLTLNIDQLVKARVLIPGSRISGRIDWTRNAQPAGAVRYESPAVPAAETKEDALEHLFKNGEPVEAFETVARARLMVFATSRVRGFQYGVRRDRTASMRVDQLHRDARTPCALRRLVRGFRF